MTHSTMTDLHHLTGFLAKFEVPKTGWKKHPTDSEAPDDDSQVTTGDAILSMTEEQ